jgi:hypothetical protein
LYGLRNSSTGTPTTDGREAVALREIDRVAIRKSNPLGTAALVAAGTQVLAFDTLHCERSRNVDMKE